MLDFEEKDIPTIESALKRYRIIAWIVGVALVLLVCVAMPLKYFANDGRWVAWIGQAHGFLYMVLLVLAYRLGTLVKWPWSWLIKIALGGTVPFVTFVAEHFATKDVRGRIFAVREAASWKKPDEMSGAPAQPVATAGDASPAAEPEPTEDHSALSDSADDESSTI